MSDIKLNFINNSNDVNNSQIVIFQKNEVTNFSENAVAWKVIKNCGRLDNHPFMYPLGFDVGAGDSYGNFTPEIKAEYGTAYEMINDESGDVLQLSAQPATSPLEVEIKNNLLKGAMDANIYKDGKLLAIQRNLVPAQKAVFHFEPKIFIGVVSQVNEGEVMDSAIISDMNCEINLIGITSADIVMTGGGSGPEATAFTFHLENINK